MSSAASVSRAQDQRKRRAPPSDTNEGDTSGKRKKPNVATTSSEKPKDQTSPVVRQTPAIPKDGPVVFHPSTSSSIIPAKIIHPAPSKLTNPNDPRPTSSMSSSSARNRLTKQLYEQIPFLENDPLKALEMLKKMVQESGLETLYGSVNENTHRSRDFSERVVGLKKNVEDILKFMISGKASEEEKLEKYKEMKAIWSKIHGLNEAKVKLTQNAYDMVDRVIRRLDKELETIGDEIGDTKTDAAETGPGVSGGKQDGPVRRRDRDFDMPVDPNEPTYCECKQISFGEMIACDNVNCPIEWFHFTCVGLTSKPKGKWFCKRCVASGQNKLGKKKKQRMGIIEKYASASDKSEVEHLLSASDESD